MTARGLLLLATAGCQEIGVRCSREPDDPYASMPCSGICINEIGADNTKFATDQADAFKDEPVEVTEDWIELYNNGGGPLPLDDLTLERNDNGFARASLAGLDDLAEGACILLVANVERFPQPDELEFDLNSDFGTLRLFQGPDRCLVDRLFYPEVGKNESYGRETDGAPRWRRFSFDESTPCGPPPLFAPEVPT